MAIRRAVLLGLGIALCGCAAQQAPRPDDDPWESFNRKMFWFNDRLDTHVMEPTARGWDWAVPEVAQRGVHNFFNNLRFPIVLVNDLLQGRGRQAVETLVRFQTNTVLGVLGFCDVAADRGMPAHPQDTGLTFARWGIAPGPYLVLPFFGPSSPRDGVGLAADGALLIYPYFIPIPGVSVGINAVNVVNERARFLDAGDRAKGAALDFYVFVRNAYVQRRWREINDGAPSAPDEDLYNEENLGGYLEDAQ